MQWKLIEDKAVLLNLDEAVLLELDEVATQIWLAIDGKKSAADIIDLVLEKFAVQRKQAQRDVSKFLKQLLREEVIRFKTEV